MHIGAHKTGTSTLQAALAKNRGALLQQGIFYPGNTEAHNSWANAVAETSDPKQLKQLASAEWLSQLQSGHALLISAESIYHHLHHANDYIEKLQIIFDQQEVIPVVCFREQASFAQLLYSEWVLNFNYSHSFYHFLVEFYSWFNYESVLEKLQPFSKTKVILYHDIAGGRLPERFMESLGFNIALNIQEPQLRCSPAESEILLNLKINQQLCNEKNQERKKSHLLINELITQKYPALLQPMPDLLWRGNMSPSIFSGSFKIQNRNVIHKAGAASSFPEPTQHFSARNKGMLQVIDAAFNELTTLLPQ